MNDYAQKLKEFIIFAVSESKRFNGWIDWDNVVDMVVGEFPEEEGTAKERIRSIYRRATEEGFAEKALLGIKQTHDRRAGRTSLREKLVNRLARKCSLEYLLATLTARKDEILAEIMQMKTEGFAIDNWNENNTTFFQFSKRLPVGGETRVMDFDEKDEIRFAIVSDTHIGHNQHAKQELEHFYDFAISKGVKVFYHAGDISDGHYTNRQTSVLEQEHVGFQDQLKAIVETYPKRNGVKTYFITGNHDYTHMKNAFANIGETVGLIRDDLIYLGHNLAKIQLTPKIDISLVHPTDGISESYSLKLQKHIQKSENGKRATIMAFGHYHKPLYMYHYGVHGFLLPSFTYQSEFMSTGNMESIVGGVVVVLKTNTLGEIVELNHTFKVYG